MNIGRLLIIGSTLFITACQSIPIQGPPPINQLNKEQNAFPVIAAGKALENLNLAIGGDVKLKANTVEQENLLPLLDSANVTQFPDNQVRVACCTKHRVEKAISSTDGVGYIVKLSNQKYIAVGIHSPFQFASETFQTAILKDNQSFKGIAMDASAILIFDKPEIRGIIYESKNGDQTYVFEVPNSHNLSGIELLETAERIEKSLLNVNPVGGYDHVVFPFVSSATLASQDYLVGMQVAVENGRPVTIQEANSLDYISIYTNRGPKANYGVVFTLKNNLLYWKRTKQTETLMRVVTLPKSSWVLN